MCLALMQLQTVRNISPLQANHGTPLMTLAAAAGTSAVEFLVVGVPPRPAGAALVDDWDCLRVSFCRCHATLQTSFIAGAALVDD